MKKLISLGLALALVLSMAACGSGNGQTKAPETQATETKAPETTIPETQATETKASETTIPETQAEKTEPQTETDALETEDTVAVSAETEEPFGIVRWVDEDPYAGIGIWEGNTYKCEAIGIKIEVPENWIQVGVPGVIGVTTREFSVQNADNRMENIEFRVEDIAVEGWADLTEQDYLNIIKEQMAATEGFEVDEEIGETSIGNTTYYTFSFDVLEYGRTETYYCAKIDGKMMIFIITATDRAVIEEIFGYFSAL